MAAPYTKPFSQLLYEPCALKMQSSVVRQPGLAKISPEWTEVRVTLECPTTLEAY